MKEKELLMQEFEKRFKIGDTVMHFKKETMTELENEKKENRNKHLYRILNIATETETNELLVIYQAMYGDFGVFARPMKLFVEKVNKEKYPHIKQEYRLQKVETIFPIRK